MLIGCLWVGNVDVTAHRDDVEAGLRQQPDVDPAGVVPSQDVTTVTITRFPDRDQMA